MNPLMRWPTIMIRLLARRCLPARLALVVVGLLLSMLAAAAAQTPHAQPAATPQPASTLLDLSGIVWVAQNTFIAVHDAKRGEEDDRPRVSIVSMPDGPTGITYRSLDVSWPDGDLSHDLESIAAIPGTDRLLLVESGDDGQAPYQRIFLATLTRDPQVAVTIDAVVPWPEPIFNVEASAVLRLADGLVFIYAERAEGQPTTELRWAAMTVEASGLTFGPFASALYAPALQGPGVRPIVGLDVDAAGSLYAVTAYDPGDDNGPFRSVISRIGHLRQTPKEGIEFVPSGLFGDIASLDGFKVEGVAVVEAGLGSVQIYAGSDDENYGATMRLVWPVTE